MGTGAARRPISGDFPVILAIIVVKSRLSRQFSLDQFLVLAAGRAAKSGPGD